MSTDGIFKVTLQDEFSPAMVKALLEFKAFILAHPDTVALFKNVPAFESVEWKESNHCAIGTLTAIVKDAL